MPLVRLFNFTAGTLIREEQVDPEFNQLVDLVSGVSTTVDMIVRLSHASLPVVRLDQLSTGPILILREGVNDRFIFKISGRFLGAGVDDATNNEIVTFASVASAVNEVTIRNAATGNGPDVEATGTNTDIPLNLKAKGVGYVTVSPFLKVITGATPHTRYERTSATARVVDWGIDNSDNFVLAISAIGNPIVIAMATQVITLSAIPVLPAANPTTANQAVRKQYVDDKFIRLKESWFIKDPNDNVNNHDTPRYFIAPAGTGMRIKKFSIIRFGGAHSAGDILTYRLLVNGTGIGSGVSFNDTNNLADTEYSEALDVAISAGDKIRMVEIANTGTLSEINVTTMMEWEQKLT